MFGFHAKMKIPTNLDTLESSNLFLRALWAEIRQTFGKCAWHCAPHKQGIYNRIFFGQADIGLDYTLLVSVTYKRKGVVNQIEFEPDTGEKLPKDVQLKLKSAVETALDTYNVPQVFLLRTVFKSHPKQFAFYNGENFVISPETEDFNSISVKVKGFDQVDAETEAQKTLNSLLDFFSVCTNSICSLALSDVPTCEKDHSTEEIYFKDFDWIDDYPILDDRLVFWQCQKDFIDQILLGAVGIDTPLLRACGHFHAAQKLWTNNGIDSSVELAVVLYVSALEVASTVYPFEGTICKECGQDIFSIRRRVKDLTRKHINHHIERFIDEYYSTRSKYLHVGILTSDYNYRGASIPLLDPGSTTGCRTQIAYPPFNLREYVAYILRKVFLEQIVEVNQ